ncbi:membrane-spanning 4-domains subfamily A member 4D-like isoform X2 [Aquarana catesbeiana]|uniref:membrane-spanning 4-domains subfamily A member 4D-like isoform X2 n=1 Tax=Aquarana catesbeiana TaxID=8400 RepID=UPI003CCA37D1
MMSDLASKCETLMNSTPSAVPSAVPASNVPVASFFQNISPPPPTFYIPPSTQAFSFPTVAPQWRLSAIIPQNMDPSLPFFQTFLKGKPKALGILVIVAAILEIGLGIALGFTRFTITFPSGIPFWGPVFYIIAASLTLAAQKKPNICLNGAYAVISLLLVINLLLFCVTISTSVFECRSLSKVQSVTQVFVLQNDVVLAMNPGAVPVPFPVTTTYAQPPPQPPAYTVNVVKA